MTASPYAHRGLHGRGVAENSLAAFSAAIASGYGIECDVRLSADGVPHIFHDDRLERLTGVGGRFAALDSATIARLSLHDGSPIPRLSDALTLIGGRVPLLVELKTGPGPVAPLCRAVASVFDSHAVRAAVMSFDPRVPVWFAAHRRSTPRGLVLSRRNHQQRAASRREALDIARARPHFLARDVRDLPAPRFGLPLLGWTARTGAQRACVSRYADQAIFERE